MFWKYFALEIIFALWKIQNFPYFLPYLWTIKPCMLFQRKEKYLHTRELFIYLVFYNFYNFQLGFSFICFLLVWLFYYFVISIILNCIFIILFIISTTAHFTGYVFIYLLLYRVYYFVISIILNGVSNYCNMFFFMCFVY